MIIELTPTVVFDTINSDYYIFTIIQVSEWHSVSKLITQLAPIIIKKKIEICYLVAAIHHLLRKSCSSTSIIFFFCHLALSTMKTVTATKRKINIRSPPSTEETTAAVIIDVLSRAGIDGETMT